VLARKVDGVWTLTTLDRADGGKLIRPEGHVLVYWDGSAIKEELTPRVSWLRGSGPHGGYSMFYDFHADRVTVDLTHYRDNWQ
jgi:hypothetical protein